MERTIGEVFELKGVKLQVVEKEGCGSCFFEDKVSCIGNKCAITAREDNTSVIFLEVKEEKKDDNINPSHYHNAGIEPIHYMKANFSKEAYSGFLEGNIIKYVSRYKQKNGINDLIKASNYLKILIDTLEEEK